VVSLAEWREGDIQVEYATWREHQGTSNSHHIGADVQGSRMVTLIYDICQLRYRVHTKRHGQGIEFKFHLSHRNGFGAVFIKALIQSIDGKVSCAKTERLCARVWTSSGH
jgi:two-component sensor histidine kinase